MGKILVCHTRLIFQQQQPTFYHQLGIYKDELSGISSPWSYSFDALYSTNISSDITVFKVVFLSNYVGNLIKVSPNGFCNPNRYLKRIETAANVSDIHNFINLPGLNPGCSQNGTAIFKVRNLCLNQLNCVAAICKKYGQINFSHGRVIFRFGQ